MKKYLILLILFFSLNVQGQYVIKNYPWQFPAVKANDSLRVNGVGTINTLVITDTVKAGTSGSSFFNMRGNGLRLTGNDPDVFLARLAGSSSHPSFLLGLDSAGLKVAGGLLYRAGPDRIELSINPIQGGTNTRIDVMSDSVSFTNAGNKNVSITSTEIGFYNSINASVNGVALTDGQALVSNGTTLLAQDVLLPPLAPVELTGVATSIGDDDLNGRIFYATASSCTLNIPESIGVTSIVDYVVVENYTASEIIIDPQGAVTLNGGAANQQVLEHRRVILRRIDSNTWEALTSP